MLWLRSKLLEQVKPSKYVLSITSFALSSPDYDGRIQDAVILSTVLGDSSVSLKNIPTALEVYDEIRRPFALDIQERSRLNGQSSSLWREDDLEHLYANHHDSLEWGMCSTCNSWEHRFSTDWMIAWTTTIDSMVEDAVTLLKAKLSWCNRYYRFG